MMDVDRYARLARHLDRLPGGYPATDSGVELRMLERLFTPHEAELALHLTLDRAPAHVIAKRAGMNASEAEKALNQMARKGLIFSVQREDGSFVYQAAPWVVGIYEFQVNNLDKQFIQDFTELIPARMKDPRAQQVIPQMRTIPVGRSVESGLEILPYEIADELVKAQEKFAVAPCICRRKAEISGTGCSAPSESCLIFGDWADYYVRNGLGRHIDSVEVSDILVKADESNLVLQPNNSQLTSFICTCCGCCCGVLNRFKMHPRPSAAVARPFIANVEVETCEGCGLCVDRCQMDAIGLEDERVSLDSNRCIGCGLCISTCPTHSLTLVRKSPAEEIRLPLDMDATWREIDAAWGK
jgi:ferredoxin